LTASPDRVEAKCKHFGICGGCSLQHLDPEKQILSKQDILLENFSRIGKVQPETILAPETGPYWGYRRKARLGVKYVRKKERVLVGFREKRNPFLADINQCEVLHPSVGLIIDDLASLIGSMEAYDRIAQIEVAVSDKATGLVFRNLEPLSEKDLKALTDFCTQRELYFYLQPAGPDSVELIWPEREDDSESQRPALSYRLEAHDTELWFEPTDFTQVNSEINQKMLNLAMELLDLKKTDRVLDLFCGIGNFSLVLARYAVSVVGVEAEAKTVERAKMNAACNNIENANFHVSDLYAELGKPEWAAQQYDKVLLDPPRSGALEVLDLVASLNPEKIVYVSCHPGSLARDAGALVNKHGYSLVSAGVMDMFPHTAHVESIALFQK
ncbi:MAG: 23S rRNA (uracil(1939)-C(5))-methyltransferase RlmD, partial [Gammaproteobacteria bacterium]|nr:23S rRNA (uracil(1939)-C(5))-methyltransferase RlmD [Gammaproteobacteria bacterium]